MTIWSPYPEQTRWRVLADGSLRGDSSVPCSPLVFQPTEYQSDFLRFVEDARARGVTARFIIPKNPTRIRFAGACRVDP